MANFITVFRIFLAFVTYGILIHTDLIYLAFVFTGFVILGDFFDGLVARKFNESSKFGAWLDIAGDRIIELGYWIVFVSQNLISPWIALVFLTRGIIVDGIRSFAQEQGYTAFGENTMMGSKLGKFIVSSNFSRFSYAVSKVIAFCLVILSIKHQEIKLFGDIFVYISLVFCVLRGLPVLLESPKFLK